MDSRQIPLSRLLKIAACLVFDAAALLFFISFWPLLLLSPFKMLMVLLVLVAGLILFNGVVMFSRNLFQWAGVAYSTTIVIWCVSYALISNLFSLLLIAGSVFWFASVQLFMLAVFLGGLAVLASFAKRAAGDQRRIEAEQEGSISIREQLLDIEAVLYAKRTEDGIQPILQSFKMLKERINASTPFGRVSGQLSMVNIEKTIWENLGHLRSQIDYHQVDNNAADIQKLIEDTRRLVMNREALNIK